MKQQQMSKLAAVFTEQEAAMHQWLVQWTAAAMDQWSVEWTAAATVQWSVQWTAAHFIPTRAYISSTGSECNITVHMCIGFFLLTV